MATRPHAVKETGEDVGGGCTDGPLQEELRRFCLPNINLSCQFKACPLNTKCSLACMGPSHQLQYVVWRHRALSLYIAKSIY